MQPQNRHKNPQKLKETLIRFLIFTLIVIGVLCFIFSSYQENNNTYPLMTIIFGGEITSIKRVLVYDVILIGYFLLLIYLPLFALLTVKSRPLSTFFVVVTEIQVISFFFLKQVIYLRTGIITEYFALNGGLLASGIILTIAVILIILYPLLLKKNDQQSV
ncbi:MAG: hypothetical protein LBR37_00185 [Erysipelotrichaceae bacterium]|jgi:hypothetical protein|nr:hypothetical protein [Erysipelotrichaceae bacterium]